MQTVELDKKLTRYLLGDVSDKERLEIEDRYLSDEEFFDELLVAEDELIDDYVRGRLSRADRDSFESNFLCSPAREERVKSARALMQFADLHGAASRVSLWQTPSVCFAAQFACDGVGSGGELDVVNHRRAAGGDSN